MTTMHLSDDQRDQFAATGLIVIDGEPAALMDAGVMLHGTIPPEGWRILTEPSPCCIGQTRYHGDGFVCPNLDCDRGRRVVTLTATCPDIVCFDNPYADCPVCDQSGVVTLGRFTIPALLPVGTCNQIGGIHVEPAGNGYPSIICGGPDNRTQLDGIDPRSGQFIARPERVDAPQSSTNHPTSKADTP